jgi:DNA-3-methyladenine glycosylase II
VAKRLGRRKPPPKVIVRIGFEPVSAEHHLEASDPVIARLIHADPARWTPEPTEDALWGLIRVVVSQQISTKAATTMTRRVARMFPAAILGQFENFNVDALRSCGLSPRKAKCCMTIAASASDIREDLSATPNRYERLKAIPGIGDWTLDMLRVLILREPDVLPRGDLGLQRAIFLNYHEASDLSSLSERWRPYRSVACWYLWRSLGNPPLG